MKRILLFACIAVLCSCGDSRTRSALVEYHTGLYQVHMTGIPTDIASANEMVYGRVDGKDIDQVIYCDSDDAEEYEAVLYKIVSIDEKD